MKALVLALLMITPVFVFSQNIVWQQSFPAYVVQMSPDAAGGIFSAQDNMNLLPHDSLKSFDAGMNLRWAATIPRNGYAVAAPGGVYIVRCWGNLPDTACIVFIDSSGVTRWTYRFASNTYQVRDPMVDRNGNLVCVYVHPIAAPFQFPGSLLKIDQSGNVLYDQPVPMRKLRNIFCQEVLGLRMDGQNRIWVVVWSLTHTNLGRKGAQQQTERTVYDAVLYASGARPRTMKFYDVVTLKDDGYGNGLTIQDPFSISMTNTGFYKGMFVIGGYMSSVRINQKGESDYSSWLLYAVSDRGKVSSVIYRGSGNVIDKSSHYAGDMMGNILTGLAVNDDAVYLIGTIFEGTKATDTPQRCLLACKPDTKNSLWTVKNLQIGSSPYDPTVRILPGSGLVAVFKDSVMKTYAPATGALQSTLSFPFSLPAGAYPPEVFIGQTMYFWQELPSHTLYKFDLSTALKGSSGLRAALSSSDPVRFGLHQNFPNPFNPATTLSFSIPEAGHVVLRIYNITGQEVATIVDDQLSSGTYQRQWNASGFASGVYVARLQAGPNVQEQKLVLMK